MIKNKSVLAVIPARGGSKGLPGKNIARLNGRPLIYHTISAALRSSYIDEVIVTTDDPKIALISRRYGALVPFIRPNYLSGDKVHTPPVIEHAVKKVEREGMEADYIVTLQPTSPLRTTKHIDNSIEILHRSRFDSVLSVKETEYPPYWIVRFKGDKAVPFVNDGTDYFKKERQQLPKTYQPNGAVYVTRRDVLLKRGVIISKNCGVMVMDDMSSLDVDTREDLIKIRRAIRGEKR